MKFYHIIICIGIDNCLTCLQTWNRCCVVRRRNWNRLKKQEHVLRGKTRAESSKLKQQLSGTIEASLLILAGGYLLHMVTKLKDLFGNKGFIKIMRKCFGVVCAVSLPQMI